MLKGIKAVAFDIDGTIYPQWKLYVRLVPYVIKNFSFYKYFNKTRHLMHRTAPLPDFYEFQARSFSEFSGKSIEDSRNIIKKVAYDGLTPIFRKIKPYNHVVECIKNFKAAGYKIAVLSDFPPEQKEEIWGVRELCDVCLGSEESGALKPSIYPFGILCEKLNLKPEEILYVGNSIKYDVVGSNNAGMTSAFVLTGWRKLFKKNIKEADISFASYRQLEKIVLQD